MFDKIKSENILFLDIETVPNEKSFEELSDTMKALWSKKAQKIAKNNESPEEIYNKAGIYAEFGKIICISVAYIIKNKNVRFLKIKSFYGHNEKEILKNFAAFLNEKFSRSDQYLCAHNGKEFDFPYIARRMLINGIKIPSKLAMFGKKPWEVPHLDTMELWRFGDYKSFTSLELLAEVFGIPTPKDDIDGADVWRIYWIDKDMDRIVKYCQKDTITVARLFLKYKGESPIEEENFIFKT